MLLSEGRLIMAQVAQEQDWAERKRRIQKRVAVLRTRLLPGAVGYELRPPKWKAWSRPSEVPIDDRVSKLIDRRRSPRLRPRAALEEAGIVCPFWYARAGVVLAVETAELDREEAERLRRDYPATRKKLDSLSDLVPRSVKNLKEIGRALSALEVAARLHPSAMHSNAQWAGDELFEEYTHICNQFSDRANHLVQTLEAIVAFARKARPGVTNNPPEYFLRSFAESIRRDFVSLTGGSSNSKAFLEYLSDAWDSGMEGPQPGWERLLKQLRKLD